MMAYLNVLDNATLWVAISFVIFVILVFKPLKNMMLTSLDTKIAELKLQLEESKKIIDKHAKQFNETLGLRNHRKYDLPGTTPGNTFRFTIRVMSLVFLQKPISLLFIVLILIYVGWSIWSGRHTGEVRKS